MNSKFIPLAVMSIVLSSDFDSAPELQASDNPASVVVRAADCEQISDLKFSPDSSILAACTDNGAITILNVKSGAIVKKLKDRREELGSVVFSPDGKRLATSGFGTVVRWWNTRTWEVEKTLDLDNRAASVRGMAFSPNGTAFAALDINNKVVLWSQDGAAPRRFDDIGEGLTSIALSRDGKVVVAADSGFGVVTYDTTTSKRIDYFENAPPTKLTEVWLSAQSQVQVSDDAARIVATWGFQVVTKEGTADPKKTSLAGEHGFQGRFALSRDGSKFVSGERYGIVKLWNAQTGQFERELGRFDERVTAADINSTGTTVAVGDRKGYVRLWKVNVSK